jgi:hypothetical protein
LATQPRYRDLTATQYASAFQWLESAGLLFSAGALPADDASRRHRALLTVFEAALTGRPWLDEALMLVPTPDDLPLDVAEVADILGLAPHEAFTAVHAAAGKVDLAERARVGDAGERSLVELLRRETSCVVEHVALTQDGLGYDVRVADPVANLEVKSTTRLGRLTLYLSRNEFEVMRVDPAWQLVAVLLDSADLDTVTALATVDRAWLLAAAPSDRSAAGRWESMRVHVAPAALTGGIPALQPATRSTGLVTAGCLTTPPSWFPLAP